MKNKKRAKRKKAHKIRASFSGGPLTNYSGTWPIFKFMEKLRVTEHLERTIALPVGDNALYTTGQILTSNVLVTYQYGNPCPKVGRIEFFGGD
jgi:hypothetical protein